MDSVNLPKLENIVDHSRFIAVVQEEVGYFVKSGSYHLSPLQFRLGIRDSQINISRVLLVFWIFFVNKVRKGNLKSFINSQKSRDFRVNSAEGRLPFHS